MMRRAVLIAMAPLMLGGCVVYASSGGETTSVRVGSNVATVLSEEPLEAIHSARFADGRAVVRVASNGCTRKEHFEVRLSAAGQSPVEMAVIRTEPDHCRALVPDGVELAWTYADLALTPGETVRLANPLIVN